MKRLFLASLLTVVIAVGVGLGENKPRAEFKSPPPPPQPLALEKLFGGPFELIDQSGKTVTDQDFRGRFMLIYFGYTFCPDICPYSLQTMIEALDILGGDITKIQPIFITADPARDTAETIKEYIARYSSDLIGLTGTDAQIRQVTKAYRISRRKIIPADPEPGNDYLVSHSSFVYLMGPDGVNLTFFPYDTDPDTMAAAISKYVKKLETAAE